MKGFFTSTSRESEGKRPDRALSAVFPSSDRSFFAHREQRVVEPKTTEEIEAERVQNATDFEAARAAAQAALQPDPPKPKDPDPLKKVSVIPPEQRFELDELTYFIVPRADSKPTPSAKGHWLVQYVIDEAGNGRPYPMDKDEKIIPPDVVADAILNTMTPKPDLTFAQRYIHFNFDTDTFHEIGERFLAPRMQKAEQADHDFALRIQGLQNSTINAVWTAEDSGEEPRDRSELMEMFLQKYLTRFLAQAPLTQDDPDNIVQEAIQMHRQFCKGWSLEHKRTLATSIEAAAEALVGMFYERHLKRAAPADMTLKELSRLLRRDAQLSPQFGLCLHFYMVKLEQDRGARNASYKSMYNAGSSNVVALNSMDRFLGTQAGYIRQQLEAVRDRAVRRFHWTTTDWFRIMSQLNRPTVRYTGAKRRNTGATRVQAPWALSNART